MVSKLIGLSVALASGLLIAAWCYTILGMHPAWPPVLLSGLAALLAGLVYAFNVRPQPGRLSLMGKNRVQVRSLDEWTLYQHEVMFEQATPEQQNEALNHYRAGLRLFPARPQDLPAKRSALDWLLMLICFCSFVSLSTFVHGWYRPLLFGVFYAWLLLCMRISKRFSEAPGATVKGLGLS